MKCKPPNRVFHILFEGHLQTLSHLDVPHGACLGGRGLRRSCSTLTHALWPQSSMWFLCALWSRQALDFMVEAATDNTETKSLFTEVGSRRGDLASGLFGNALIFMSVRLSTSWCQCFWRVHMPHSNLDLFACLSGYTADTLGAGSVFRHGSVSGLVMIAWQTFSEAWWESLLVRNLPGFRCPCFWQSLGVLVGL